MSRRPLLLCRREFLRGALALPLALLAAPAWAGARASGMDIGKRSLERPEELSA